MTAGLLLGLGLGAAFGVFLKSALFPQPLDHTPDDLANAGDCRCAAVMNPPPHSEGF